MSIEEIARKRLTEISARAEAAVSGPWFLDDCEGRIRVYQQVLIEDTLELNPDGSPLLWGPPSSYRPEQMILDIDVESWDIGQDAQDDQIRANAEFIATARSDVPRLVAALTAVLDKHTEWHTCLNADNDGLTDYAANDDCLKPCPTYLAVAAVLEES